MKVKLIFEKLVPEYPKDPYTWYKTVAPRYDCSSAIELFDRLMKLRQRQFLSYIGIGTLYNRGRSFRSGVILLASNPAKVMIHRKHHIPLTKEILATPELLDSLAGEIWRRCYN